jgi:hypothetical protein
MSNEKIIELLKFNAPEIAQIISDCEWMQKNANCEYDKKYAKRNAYEHIAELIFGEERAK